MLINHYILDVTWRSSQHNTLGSHDQLVEVGTQFKISLLLFLDAVRKADERSTQGMATRDQVLQRAYLKNIEFVLKAPVGACNENDVCYNGRRNSVSWGVKKVREGEIEAAGRSPVLRVCHKFSDESKVG